MKVKIKNFQSIKELEIDIEGFTTIVGKSNIGKSSIVRAIDGALTNRKGDNFVRKGEHHSEVHIQCPDIDVKWKKGGGHNDYIVKKKDGELVELTSVGHGTPEIIGESGFRPVESNRSTFSVQVASQFNPIFLLDSSKTTGSEVAEIISDIGRLSEVQEAFSQCQKDRKNIKNNIRVREKDLADTKEQLTRYENIDDDMKQVEEIKTQHKDIGTFKEDLKSLSSLEEEKQEVNEVLDHFDDLETITIPSWNHDSLLKEVDALGAFKGTLDNQNKTLDHYKGLDELEIPEFDEDDLLRQVRSLSGFQSHVNSAEKDVDKYEGLVEVEVPDIGDLVSLQKEYQELVQLNQDMNQVEDAIPSLNNDIESITDSIENVATDIHGILVEAGSCPVCGEEVEND